MAETGQSSAATAMAMKAKNLGIMDALRIAEREPGDWLRGNAAPQARPSIG